MRALAPLVAAFGEARPGWRRHVSAVTRGGRQMAERLFDDCSRGPAPIGLWPGRAVARVAPRLLVLEYLELWPAWIAAVARMGGRIAVVDGRITRRSLRIRPLLRAAAARLDVFCARTAADAAAAEALGVPRDRIRVCGNGKYDGVPLDPPAPTAELRRAIGPRDVVVGSLHPDEEGAALGALAHSGSRVLIAPRYPRRAAAIERRARDLGVEVARRSVGAAGAQWAILDTIGELAAAYALAPVAIVGGTFGRRDGQTLVEPAAHGVPVIHGPRVGNVAVEAEALAGRGGWPVDDWRAACAMVAARRVDPGPDPRPALAGLTGATGRNLDALLSILDSSKDLGAE